jgi:hypothetical protein
MRKGNKNYHCESPAYDPVMVERQMDSLIVNKTVSPHTRGCLLLTFPPFLQQPNVRCLVEIARQSFRIASARFLLCLQFVALVILVLLIATCCNCFEADIDER